MQPAGSAVHPSRTPAPGRYRLDPTRTTIRFQTRHLFGLGVVAGHFSLRGGYIEVATSISDSTVRAVVRADSIDTDNPRRDRSVRSATYLDAQNYPDLEFIGDAVDNDGLEWTIGGSLTAHGVSAPVELRVHAVDLAVNQITVHATTKVDRYAHGITAQRGFTGRWLTIDIVAVATWE